MMRTAWIVLLAASLSLSACGDAQPDFSLAEIRSTLSAAGVIPSEPTEDVRALVTPENLAGTETLFFSEIPEIPGSQSFLFLQTTTNGIETWQDAGRVSLSLRSGVLVATRGIGGDLMSLSSDEVMAALYGGATQAIRVHRYLDRENQLQLASFVCDYRRGAGVMTDPLVAGRPALLIVEDCINSDGTSFENRYWLDTDGLIRQSSQWAGPEIGQLTMVRIKG